MNFWKPNSLKQHFFISFLVLGVILSIIIDVILFRGFSQHIQTSTEAQLAAVTKAKERTLNYWLADRVRDVQSIAQSPLVQDNMMTNPDSVSWFLAELKGVYQIYHEITIFSTKGNPLASSGYLLPTQNRAQWPFFIRAMQGGVGFQNIYYAKEMNAVIMTVYAPIYDRPPDPIDRRIISIVAMHIRMDDTIWKILTDRTGLGETGESYLVKYYNDGMQLEDSDKLVLASPSRFPKDLLKMGFKNPQDPLDYVLNTALEANTDAVQECLAGNAGTKTYRDYRNETCIGAYHYIPGPNEELRWALITQRDKQAVYAGFTGLVLMIILIEIILIAAFSYVLALWMVARVSSAVTHISETINTAVSEETTTHLDSEIVPNELQLLTNRINELLAQINIRKVRQSEYIQLQQDLRLFHERFEESVNGIFNKNTKLTLKQLPAIADIYQEFSIKINRLNDILDELKTSVTYIGREATLIIDQTINDTQQQSDVLSELKTIGAEIQEIQIRLRDHIDSMMQESREFLELILRSNELQAETIASLSSSKGQIQTLVQLVEQVNGRAQNISDVIRMMGDMASQISILALNASIEAARAGESGQGFSIVASKIQALGERAISMSKDMTVQVRTLQSETNEAVVATEVYHREIEAGLRQAERSRTSLQTLEGQATTVIDQIKRLTTDAKVQGHHTEKITMQQETVVMLTQRITKNIKQVSEQIRQLTAVSEKLQQTLSIFQPDDQKEITTEEQHVETNIDHNEESQS